MEINQIIQGDCLEVLKGMPAESVHCCITSPPYWGLRDYSLPPQIWDGKEDCEHEWSNAPPRRNRWAGDVIDEDSKQFTNKGTLYDGSGGAFCRLCSAWRGSLGLEPTPELYVQHLVQIFREVRRVLRKDGTCWINLGDSYAGSGSPGGDFRDGKGGDEYLRPYNRKGSGLKPKDLCGIPWRVAFALQADGWYLRSDIIWAKPNPMPESCRDRPTKAHEYLFLLTKSAKYYYDQDAIREAQSYNGKGSQTFGAKGGKIEKLGKPTYSGKDWIQTGFRNKRTVWTIATQPYPEAHFATFPEKLVEPCILAGTSAKGCCPECGAPWARVVEIDRIQDNRRYKDWRDVGWEKDEKGKAKATGNPIQCTNPRAPLVETIGWRPTCECNQEPIPCIVLDPFMGSGTVALVAKRNNRSYMGIELNPDYIEMANKRIKNITPKLMI